MKTVPKEYRDLNVQDLLLDNKTDANGNPTGGEVHGPGLEIRWQDGPRAVIKGSLAPATGAFVEDAIYAALQRLEFFQGSKYATSDNDLAIHLLNDALEALEHRRRDRRDRGVEGQHQI